MESMHMLSARARERGELGFSEMYMHTHAHDECPCIGQVVGLRCR